MKKFIKILAIMMCILMFSVPVFAMNIDNAYEEIMLLGVQEDNTSLYNDTRIIKVQLNGDLIDFTDELGNKVEPQIINNRTMVPMRKIFEVFGATVKWIPETRSIIATLNGLEIGLQIDNAIATVKTADGSIKSIMLDAAPTIVGDRTLVPVRFIAESLDKIVDWDSSYRTVIIVNPDIVEDKIKNDASNLYEYLTADYQELETSESTATITGKVVYEDDSKDYMKSTLNLEGDFEQKKSETALAFDFNLDITGKGILKDAVEENGYDEIEVKGIVDVANGVTYFSSELFETDKWVRYEIGTAEKYAMNVANASTNDFGDMVYLLMQTEDGVNINSYGMMMTKVDMICSLMSNKNFVSKGKINKVYTLNIDLDDIISALKVSTKNEKTIRDVFDIEVTSKINVVDNIIKKSVINVKLELSESTEKVEIELDIVNELTRYNKSVHIAMPKEVDIKD